MKGILFNHQYGMFQATVAGTKTQTRRSGGLGDLNKSPDGWRPVHMDFRKGKAFFVFRKTIKMFSVPDSMEEVIVKPRYQVGDIVYLKEPVMVWKRHNLYKYEDPGEKTRNLIHDLTIDQALEFGKKWQNKLFMKQEYARYYVKITSVKIERLRKISVKDCVSEGVVMEPSSFPAKVKWSVTDTGVKLLFSTARKAYFSLYNAIGKIKKPENPWVFVYDYELCQKPAAPLKKRKA